MKALPTKAQSGFTLVELVIMLVLIGILAASVLPKILGRSSTDALTTQDQIISVLRLLQLQSMQQTDLTNSAFCRQVLITSSAAGLPDQNSCTPLSQFSAAASTDNPTQFIVNDSSQVMISVFNQASGGSVVLPPADAFRFRFSIKGQPVHDTTGDQYQDGLRIEISDGDTFSICIEDEGYIHPC